MKQSVMLLLLLFAGLIGAQNSVSGTFSPAETYTFAFLYKATPNGAKFVDRARLDSNGSFTIALDSTQASGMYKIVYAVPVEENNFDFIYNGKEAVAFEFNPKTGVVFTESRENKLWASYMKSMGVVNQTISHYYQNDGEDPKAFKGIFKTLEDTQNAYENSAKGMLVLELIRANHPYIPANYEDISTYSNQLKSTFFDHIDFDSDLLNSSSFITDRLNSYMFGGSDTPSNYAYKSKVSDIAKVISTSRDGTQLRVYRFLWEGFVQLNNDELTTYIANNYLLPLANSLNNTDLVKRIEAQNRTAIGVLAPDFSITTTSMSTSLHKLKDETTYVLIFWSSGCSHCLKEIPMVHDLLKDNNTYTVIAYGLEDDVAQWQQTITNFPTFLHVYGPKKWDNPIVEEYNLTATPTYLILDSDKRIMAKPENFESLERFINR